MSSRNVGTVPENLLVTNPTGMYLPILPTLGKDVKFSPLQLRGQGVLISTGIFHGFGVLGTPRNLPSQNKPFIFHGFGFFWHCPSAGS